MVTFNEVTITYTDDLCIFERTDRKMSVGNQGRQIDFANTLYLPKVITVSRWKIAFLTKEEFNRVFAALLYL